MIGYLNGICKNHRLTLIVSAVSLAAFALPTLSDWLELDFAAAAAGQWWRIWTGHLTHYDGQHLFWDLLMFVVLGVACERQHPRFFVFALPAMMAGISLAIACSCPGILMYRGLSGLDTGLFVWLVVDQFRASFRQRHRAACVLWLLPAVGLIGKLAYEALTGQMLFVQSGTFTPLVQSHLAGAALGLVYGCVSPNIYNRQDLMEDLVTPRRAARA